MVWAFPLGMPITELASGAVLHDVDPESEAYRAGLRDGQTLLAWLLWPGDPIHGVVLTVRAAARPAMLQLRYLPRGHKVTIPPFELLPRCDAGSSEGAPAL